MKPEDGGEAFKFNLRVVLNPDFTQIEGVSVELVIDHQYLWLKDKRAVSLILAGQSECFLQGGCLPLEKVFKVVVPVRRRWRVQRAQELGDFQRESRVPRLGRKLVVLGFRRPFQGLGWGGG